jgi:hypothetical protein
MSTNTHPHPRSRGKYLSISSPWSLVTPGFLMIFRNTSTGSKLSISKFSNTRTTHSLFSEQVSSIGMLQEIERFEVSHILNWISTHRVVGK